MVIAVASGKGGTGKTTVASSLAHVWDGPVTVVDLDVEEPNLHLFLKPEITGRRSAVLETPTADETKCTACRACVEICQFKAISLLGETLLLFPEMCHGCGGCLAVCPEGALTPGARELGEVLWGRAGRIGFVMGRLRIGEAMSPPLMRRVRAKLDELQAQEPSDVIIDAPPGTSCPAMNAVEGADAIVLVTEPTPFGLFDLRLARQAFAQLEKPMAVVVNRAGLGDDALATYCRAAGLPILAEIPFDRAAAEAYADGRIIAQARPGYAKLFSDLAARIVELVQTDREAESA